MKKNKARERIRSWWCSLDETEDASLGRWDLSRDVTKMRVVGPAVFTEQAYYNPRRASAKALSMLCLVHLKGSKKAKCLREKDYKGDHQELRLEVTRNQGEEMGFVLRWITSGGI